MRSVIVLIKLLCMYVCMYGKDRRSVLFSPANSAFWKRLAHLLNMERSGECATVV